MSPIVQVCSTPKMKLNYHNQLDKMRCITKCRQVNDVTYHKGVISTEYNTEVLRPNKQCAVYDEDETGQQCNRSYRSTLHQK